MSVAVVTANLQGELKECVGRSNKQEASRRVENGKKAFRKASRRVDEWGGRSTRGSRCVKSRRVGVDLVL